MCRSLVDICRSFVSTVLSTMSIFCRLNVDLCLLMSFVDLCLLSIYVDLCLLYVDYMSTLMSTYVDLCRHMSIFCRFCVDICRSFVCRFNVDLCLLMSTIIVDSMSTICRLDFFVDSIFCRLNVDICRSFADLMSTYVYLCRLLFVDLCLLFVDYMSIICRLYVYRMSTKT